MGARRPVDDLPDRGLLQTYLEDHLTGATGIVRLLERMRASHQDLSVSAQIIQLCHEVSEDRARLQEVMTTLGLHSNALKLAAARAGELAGRLKLNNRLTSRSPLSPLLEFELVQSGISGKTALWRTLTVHAGALGLDADEFRGLEDRALQQLDVVVDCHRRLTREAFLPPGAEDGGSVATGA